MAQTVAHQDYWSTEHSPAGGELAYWIDAVGQAMLHCAVESSKRAEFSASLRKYPLGVCSMFFIRSDRSDITRSARAIARGESRAFYLVHHRNGRILVEQQGRRAVVEVGDCVLLDGDAPYRISGPDRLDGLTMAIPRSQLCCWLPEPEAAVARTLPARDGWGGALAATLANFGPEAPGRLPLGPSIIVDQILAHLAAATDLDPTPATGHQRALLRRLRDSLQARFHEPDLDPAGLAAEHRLSKRYLHALFAKAGTSFGQELSLLRLERARQLLEDPRFRGLCITEVALRCGYQDPNHFARRFRARYGVPPSTHRRGAHS